MRIPDLSHLQFLVLSGLHGGESSGREIRDELKRYRVRQSGPAFYQMMARLEKGGLVKGWYTQDVVDGQIIKERRYRIAAAGERAWQDSRKFYATAIDEVEGGAGLAHA